MKLEPNEMPDALAFALRLTEVSRWGIVATSRQQSTGEHAYRVCIIAMAMYDFMENGTPHNSYDRNAIAAFAISHDILEVLTGDLDSVFKSMLRARFPNVYETVEKEMAVARRDSTKVYDTVMSMERSAKGTIVEAIVKLADMTEAVIYLNTYGTNTRHVQQVRDHILRRLNDKLQGYGNAYDGLGRYDWNRVFEFINTVLDKPGIVQRPTRELHASNLHLCYMGPRGNLCMEVVGHDGPCADGVDRAGIARSAQP